MWMMGYSHDGADFNMAAAAPDSFNVGGAHKLRPLVPRPGSFRTINAPDLLAFNHHITTNGMGSTQQHQQQQTQQVVVSSRWNPTPEQLQTLEELYRRGTRTPSADQIQHITAQLRRFGKIEGKNVFYWFQNHKARERQKRRRQLESTASPVEEINQPHINNVNGSCVYDLERKESAGGVNSCRAVFELEQTKSWIPSTNFSTLAEKSISILEKGGKAGAECRTDGWVQFHEQREILHPHLIASSSNSSLQMEKNATWQMMQSPTTHPLLNTTTHINSNNNIIPQAITTITSPITTRTCSQDHVVTNTNIWSKMGPRIFIQPENICDHHRGRIVLTSPVPEAFKTLQLFPLQGGSETFPALEEDHAMTEKQTDDMGGGLSSAPYQFFEFLPMKN